MMKDVWWIAAVDHRISTALIFFALVLLLGNRQKKQAFGARALISLAVMAGTSWCMRFVIDTQLTGVILEGIGYSVYMLVMGAMFLGSYAFCYRGTVTEYVQMDVLAVIIYKLAWNTFKAFASAWNTTGTPPLWGNYSAFGSLVSYAVYLSVCILCCCIYKRLVKQLPADMPPAPMLLCGGCIMLLLVVLEYCGHVFTLATPAQFMYYLCTMLYTLINFVVLMTLSMLQAYRQDNEEMQRFIANKMQYYQMSRDGITSLQVKCHDLKHQIAAIRSEAGKASFDQYIARLEDSIIEYGTVVECGNETINIVLTEKNILCSTCDVKFSYLIDGTLFDFMNEMELYSLFGNALDNALESCSKVNDPEKRVISLKASTRNGMVVLHVENCYEESLNMVDGMPKTTKVGSGHGFGLRSIQEIAEKYNGVVSIQAEDHIFKLTVLLRP